MYRPSNYTDEQWSAYKEAVAQPDREWALTLAVTLENGVQLQLDENDIVANSLVFKEQSTCSNGIMVGSTFSNSLDFTLLNEDGRFRQYSFINGKVDATVKLYVPELENWAEVKLGTFFIIEAGKKYTTIPVKCMDMMYKFNIPLNKAEPIFPINLQQLYYKVCMLVVGDCPELCDPIPNLTLNAFDTTDITCRDFLAYLGCLMGKNFRMSRTNMLETFWYTDSDCVTTPDTRISITLNDLTVHPTAVSVKDWGGKEYVQENADTSYLIAFETNPLIQTEEMAVSVLANLTDLLTAVQYRTYDCSFSGDPAVQAGDTIVHQMVMEEQQVQESIPSLIMTHEYRFRGTGKVAAVGEAAEQDRQQSAEAKKIQDVQIQAAKDLNEGLSFAQQILLNQSKLFGESLALYCGTKLDEQGRLLGFYMASEPIFPDDGIITSDDQVKDTECYVWVFGANFGVSSTGYKGPYTAGITKDQSIFAKTITADWIRTGVLSAIDDTLSIDLQSGRQTLTSKDGWGQTVLDGIGAIFTYWNKNVVGAETDGYPKMAYLQITADANQQADTDTYETADLKLTWSTYDGKMHTTIGHTIVHAADGSVVESFYPFEIKSSGPVHLSPSLYYDESLLFDNIVMHRTNLVQGNTGVDFLRVPNAIPKTPSDPIPDGQVNLMPNPGFEEHTITPWTLQTGYWRIITSSAFIHTGEYAAMCNDGSSHVLVLPATVAEQMGMYNHPVYIGFWFKPSEEDPDLANEPLRLRSGDSTDSDGTVYIEGVSDGSAWKYASAILPALESGEVISLWSTGVFGYAIDDFYVYDAQDYLLEQWDDYVARGAN